MSFLLWSLLAVPPSQRDLDELVQASRQAWQVPGLAAVVVHQGRIVYLKGSGIRRIGSTDPIGPDTVFPLASCTKPLTALTLAMLVEGGKLDWDDPVRKHLPYFHLKDPCADRLVTVRDLLCHRTGLGRHDLLWYRSPWSVEERIRKVALLDADAGFRAAFGYQPVLFAAAGEAGARSAGMSWADLVQKRLLGPLGMSRSRTTGPENDVDRAEPHRRLPDGTCVAIPRYPMNDPDPAGSVHSTARDLAAILRLQLDGGYWQGRALISTAQLEETHQTQMAIRREGFARLLNPETVQLGYGLGWVVQDYRGRLLVLHGGAIDGFRAQITLVPQIGLGIALLNNLDGTLCNLALTNLIIDRFLDVESRDWNGYYLAIQRKEEAQRTQGAARAEKTPKMPPLPWSAYAGEYQDAAYGTCRVQVRENSLSMSWGTLTSPLEYLGKHKFVANQYPLQEAPFDFSVDSRGRVTGVQALGRFFERPKSKEP